MELGNDLIVEVYMIQGIMALGMVRVRVDLIGFQVYLYIYEVEIAGCIEVQLLGCIDGVVSKDLDLILLVMFYLKKVCFVNAA